VNTEGADWSKTLANIGLMSSTGVVMVLITEEGFFRGWLWASLKRAGRSDTHVLVWNGLDYPLYGFGEKVGALGIDQTHLYGPEVGLLGILLNAAFVLLIWRFYVGTAGK